tara:strand:- start:18218 stop:19414 length:1197 start_codon:yes stop_codon:yes gene_type:complete
MNSIIKKILSLLKLKFTFSLPEKKDLLIFDDEALIDLRYVVEEFNYTVLRTRVENFNELNLNPKILFKTLFNFKGNIVNAYLISLIKEISPKIILTNIDNSWKFSEIARVLNNKYKFFAIQNGSRYDFKRYEHQFKQGIYKKNMNKIFFIPNLFCFGDFEIDDYKKFQIPVKNFYPVGSLRLANFIHLNKIDITKKKDYQYDICLISDSMVLHFDKRFGTQNDIERFGKYLRFTIKYVRENDKKFICAFAKINSSKKILEGELLFYKTFLEHDDYEYLIKNSTLNLKKTNYLTYDAMLKSNVSFCAFSTLIREHMSIGRKAISINFMKNDLFKFPINGDCKLGECEYDNFKYHIDKVLASNEVDYLNSFDKPVSYLMQYDKYHSTFIKIKEILKKHLR